MELIWKHSCRLSTCRFGFGYWCCCHLEYSPSDFLSLLFLSRFVKTAKSCSCQPLRDVALYHLSVLTTVRYSLQQSCQILSFSFPSFLFLGFCQLVSAGPSFSGVTPSPRFIDSVVLNSVSLTTQNDSRQKSWFRNQKRLIQVRPTAMCFCEFWNGCKKDCLIGYLCLS